MSLYILYFSFPVLFLIHDLEELIGMQKWIDINLPDIRTRFPRVVPILENFSTRGMVVAVAEELVLAVTLSLLAYFCKGVWFVSLWWGTFAAYAFHLVVHLVQCIVLQRRIPCLLTSIVCLPVSIYILYKFVDDLSLLPVSLWGIAALVGLLLVGANLIFLHRVVLKKFR